MAPPRPESPFEGEPTAELLLNVLLTTVRVAPSLKMAPPSPEKTSQFGASYTTTLPLKVLLVTVRAPVLAMAPPK